MRLTAWSHCTEHSAPLSLTQTILTSITHPPGKCPPTHTHHTSQSHTCIPLTPPTHQLLPLTTPTQSPIPLCSSVTIPIHSLAPHHRLPAVLGSRDHSLFLFRSLGKVFYCKRTTASAAQNTHNTPTSAASSLKLPAHLHMHERSPLEANPEVDERGGPGTGFGSGVGEWNGMNTTRTYVL